MLTFLLTRAYGKRNLPAGEGVNGLTLKVNRLTHGPKERESNIKRKNIYIYILIIIIIKSYVFLGLGIVKGKGFCA